MQNPEQDVKPLPVDATGNVGLIGETACYIAGVVLLLVAICLTLNIFYNTAALLEFIKCILFFCSATAMLLLVWHFRQHVKHAIAALIWLAVSCVLYAILNQWMGA